MGIVNQPKPSEPKSPVADQQPLQPGGGVGSNPLNSSPSTRVAPEAPEQLREEYRDVADIAHRQHEKK